LGITLFLESDGGPTGECTSQACIVLNTLPGTVNIHKSFSDGLAVVDHFQLCNFLPSFLLLMEAKEKALGCF